MRYYNTVKDCSFLNNTLFFLCYQTFSNVILIAACDYVRWLSPVETLDGHPDYIPKNGNSHLSSSLVSQVSRQEPALEILFVIFGFERVMGTFF